MRKPLRPNKNNTPGTRNERRLRRWKSAFPNISALMAAMSDSFRQLMFAAKQRASLSPAFAMRRLTAFEQLEARNLLAADIIASKVDVPDNNPVLPSDNIRYIVTIQNIGDMDATNVNFSDTIDGNTTLVGGSVSVTPLAFDDAYNATGNVTLMQNAAGGLLMNDFDPDGPGAPVLGTDLLINPASVSKASGTTTGDGTLTVAANGSFTYTPPAGETGNEQWQYTVTDGDGLDGNEVGMVSFTINNFVWFVDNSVGGPGSGTQADPFNDFSQLDGGGDVDAPGDTIFVFEGTGTTAGLTVNNGLPLEDNQMLIGEGAGLASAGISAGNRPTTGGISLAQGNTIRGLDINSTSGAGLSGLNFGTATISEVAITADGDAGIDLDGGTGTFTFDSLSSSNSSGKGINLDGVGGTLSVTGSTTITNPANDGIDINGATGTATFDFGNTTINDSAGSDQGIDITSSGSATFTFSDLDITTSNAPGLFASNAGAINVSSGDVSTGSGVGIDIDNTTLGITFTSITSSGAGEGINLDTTTGSFAVTGDGSTATQGGNDSGGVITTTGASNDGIVLNNATNVTLRNMTIGDTTTSAGDGPNNQITVGRHGISASNVMGLSFFNVTISETGDDGVNGTNVTNFRMEDSQVLNAGDGQEENGLDFTELRGDNFVIDSLFDAFNETGIELSNASGTVDLTISGSTFQDNLATVGNAGEEGILLDATGTATMIVLIDNSTFQDLRQAIDATPLGTSSLHLTVENSTIITAPPPAVTAGDGMIKVNPDGQANANVTINDNTLTNGFPIFAKNDSQGRFDLTVQGNTVNNATLVAFTHDDSGSGPGGTANGTSVLLIGGTGNGEGNTVNSVPDSTTPISIIGRETPATGGDPDISVSIHNNTLPAIGHFANFDFTTQVGIFVEARDATRLELDITGNTAFSENDSQVGQRGGITLEQENASVFRIEGLAGAANTFVNGNNTSNPAAETVGNYSATVGNVSTPTATMRPNPLMAAPPASDQPTAGYDQQESATPISPASSLGQSDFDSIVDAAKARWAATGLSAEQSSALDSVNVRVRDMAGWYLADATGANLTFDVDAAGYGWYIDATPLDDSDDLFDGQIDLLTTVMHEMGHVLGLTDIYSTAAADDLMYGFLSAGQRRLPADGQADGAVPFSIDSTAYIGAPIDIGTLPPSKSVTITFDVTVNAGVTGGTIISNQGNVTADGGINVDTDDPDQGGAADATTTTVGGGGAAPDLVGQSFDVNPLGSDTVNAGETIMINSQVLNNGTAAAGASSAEIYLSTDSNIDPGTDLLILTLNVPGRNPGQSANFNSGVALPAQGDAFWAGDGTYFVGVVWDSNNDVAESSENNNRNQGIGIDVDDITVNNTAAAQPATISDFVWDDLDADGIQDSGEPGIVGATVNLLDATGTNQLQTTNTGAGGLYSFTVAPGTYIVEFVAPGGFSFSPQDQGGDDTVDSDANPATGRTAPVTVAAGATDDTIDAGLNTASPPPPAFLQIIDDGDPGYNDSGFTNFLGGGFDNDVHFSHRNARQSATWTFTGLAAGNYRVSATWPEHPNRATDAPFEILDGAISEGTIQINQEQAPDDFGDQNFQWEDLGIFNIGNSTLTVRLTDIADEFVIADAIRVELVTGDPEVEVFKESGAAQIVDNDDAGYSQTEGWEPFAAGHLGDLRFTTGEGFNPPLPAVATWSFSGLTAGTYLASATWPAHPNRATNAPFSVFDGTNVIGTVQVNQELAPNDFADQGSAWENLGVFTISGSELNIQLSNRANDYVIADAVRVVPLMELTDGADTLNFGTTSVGSPLVETLHVRNVGNAPLTLSDPILPAGFSISSPFGAGFLSPGGSTGVQIQLNAAAGGTSTGAGSFANGDADENPFDFNLSGTVSIIAQIIDNLDAGYVDTGFVEFPRPGRMDTAQGFLGDVSFSARNAGHTATWTFTGLTNGAFYNVSATWTAHPNRATNAQFDVEGNPVVVNQEAAPDADVVVGSTNFQNLVLGHQLSGTTLTVTLSDTANDFVIADAIRVEQMLTQVVDVGDSTPLPEAPTLLQQQDVDAIYNDTIAYWQAIDASAANILTSADVRIADLNGPLLGLASPVTQTIWLDTNAAGYGWHIDATAATEHSSAIDLAAVFTHELGHLLGLRDLDEPAGHDNIMAVSRAVDARRPMSIIDESPYRALTSGLTTTADYLYADWTNDSLPSIQPVKSVEESRPLHDLWRIQARQLQQLDAFEAPREEDPLFEFSDRYDKASDVDASDLLFAALGDDTEDFGTSTQQ
jgi:uncharacterized repeat protein (TIGR01451 family)